MNASRLQFVRCHLPTADAALVERGGQLLLLVDHRVSDDQLHGLLQDYVDRLLDLHPELVWRNTPPGAGVEATIQAAAGAASRAIRRRICRPA